MHYTTSQYMSKQITSNILMIRPANFGYNAETAANNAFQSKETKDTANEIKKKAIKEFDAMVDALRSHGINVIVHQDTTDPVKPDAVFPNNWVSFHNDGAVITYPMFAKNRRIERSEEIIEELGNAFDVKRRYTFEHYEEDEQYLEGTGSMLFDRENNIVYACLSERTSPQLIDKYVVLRSSDKVVVHANDRNGDPIYHTNVMMALGVDFAVVCLDSISKEDERQELVAKLQETGKEIIDISFDQMEQYTGNMLEVCNHEGKRFLVMSEAAHKSLNKTQIEALSAKTNILSFNIDTIEYFGGGSVRCMMAEVFLPKK